MPQTIYGVGYNKGYLTYNILELFRRKVRWA